MLEITADGKIGSILSELDRALAARDLDATLALFAEDGYWRDLVAFTWNIKTLEGKGAIRSMLDARLADVHPRDWIVDANERATESGDVVEGFITFETSIALGYGYIRLKRGQIWTLLTTMRDLKGHEEPSGLTRPFGAKHGAHQGEPTWADERRAELAALGTAIQPYVLIIGGGQGGIGLAARLRQQGVPALIVEKNERPGDSWRHRYKSLCLHDPVWYDHMPYIKFPDNWPVFSPKDKLADWLEMYAKVMELDFWGGTKARRASYDEKSAEWTVVVERDGREVVLRPKQLVLATGMSGKPNLPAFSGRNRFSGAQMHSSEYHGPDGLKGKTVVVIGSNNSAHDICADLALHGIDVTMVQRSSTHVSRSASLLKYSMGTLYSEEALARGITTEKADLLAASVPYALAPSFQKPVSDAIRKHDAAFYRALQSAGFMLNFGADDTGLFMLYIRRASGYYIDVGASQLIIDGKIKLASGSEIKELGTRSILLVDGRELAADVVVYATGYGSMNGFAADLISQRVADKVGKVWGLGSDTPKDPGPWEGEERNMWKPTRQDALWFHGGNLAQSRFYSHYLALQLKARMLGIPTPVYGVPQTHHLS